MWCLSYKWNSYSKSKLSETVVSTMNLIKRVYSGIPQFKRNIVALKNNQEFSKARYNEWNCSPNLIEFIKKFELQTTSKAKNCPATIELLHLTRKCNTETERSSRKLATQIFGNGKPAYWEQRRENLEFGELLSIKKTFRPLLNYSRLVSYKNDS